MGDVYNADHRVIGERAVKERERICKGIPGLRSWLARHNAILVPLLWAYTPRWQAAPKDWSPERCTARTPRRHSSRAAWPKPPR